MMDMELTGGDSPDEALVRAVHPDGAPWVEIATSYSHHVPEDEERELAHGWGVAPHDYDVQAYQRIRV